MVRIQIKCFQLLNEVASGVTQITVGLELHSVADVPYFHLCAGDNSHQRPGADGAQLFPIRLSKTSTLVV